MPRMKGLEVDRRVGIALSVLPPSQKQLVERVIKSPRTFATAATVPGDVQQLANADQTLYQLRVSPSLRLIYTMIGETVYVVDVVERETQDRFARLKAAEKSVKTPVAKKALKANGKKPRGVLDQ